MLLEKGRSVKNHLLRLNELYNERLRNAAINTDKLFVKLFLFQWFLGLVLAVYVAPNVWKEDYHSAHIGMALFVGALLGIVPYVFIRHNPGAPLNRNIIAVAQMCFSILFIHLTGGRIETHFHIFGSLAFLAFYRDWKPLAIATLITSADHFLRGVYWPQSVYGTESAGYLRALEHAAWVLFEDVFLWISIKSALQGVTLGAVVQAELEENLKSFEDRVKLRTQELEKSQEELLEQKTLMEAVFSNIPTMLLVKDCKRDMKTTLVNKAGEAILGLSQQELKQNNIPDLNLLSEDKYVQKSDLDVVKEKQIVEIEKHAIQTPWGPRFLRTTKVPVYDTDGQAELLLYCSSDITFEIATKEALEQERSRSFHNSKLASLGEMSAGIAHEINNPLAIIVGTLPLLLKFKNDPDKFTSKIELIEKSSARIEKIVKGLKKFARSSGEDVFHPYSLVQIITDCLVLTEMKSKQNLIHIDFTWDREGLIQCDEVEIEQVFINLINNSIEAIKNLPERWIKIKLKCTYQEVVVQIRDSGNGLPLEVQKKLFQPFFTTKSVGEGTGLGLSIVRGILNQHRAAITLDTKDSHTCFELRFQIHKENQNAA